MPGPVSDSFDPEFGTGAAAAEVAAAIREVREEVTRQLNTDELMYIVHVARGEGFKKGRKIKARKFTERELRIIRFCLDRSLESI